MKRVDQVGTEGRTRRGLRGWEGAGRRGLSLSCTPNPPVTPGPHCRCGLRLVGACGARGRGRRDCKDRGWEMGSSAHVAGASNAPKARSTGTPLSLRCAPGARVAEATADTGTSCRVLVTARWSRIGKPVFEAPPARTHSVAGSGCQEATVLPRRWQEPEAGCGPLLLEYFWRLFPIL